MFKSICITVDDVYTRGYEIPPRYTAEFRKVVAGDTFLNPSNGKILTPVGEPSSGYFRICLTPTKWDQVVFTEVPGSPRSVQKGEWYRYGEEGIFLYWSNNLPSLAPYHVFTQVVQSITVL